MPAACSALSWLAAVRDDLRSHPDIPDGGTGRQARAEELPEVWTVTATPPPEQTNPF